ncbi:MAG: MarR family transcriptional regulator [Gammaproteobacteria bacterium]|nr:MarR family transcriptional regulator [Gammaproteobacteria bacterium]
MNITESQRRILQQLKIRGAQFVKILSNQLTMTTMGIRQHLTDLEEKGLIKPTREERQTRGRPVRLWKLAGPGHQTFTDGNAQLALELLDLIRDLHGENALNGVLIARNIKIQEEYSSKLRNNDIELSDTIKSLAEIRSNEGYMCEVRLLPDGWLFIENHCPIYAATKHCEQFYHSELSCFQNLFDGVARVQRVDHIYTGARRCAYKIRALNQI